jgi:hypothetical protein
MRVLGLDLATNTGCADGFPGGTPRCFTWRLGLGADDRPAKLANLLRYFERYLRDCRPDAVFYERGLAVAVASRIGVNEETVGLLRGAIGIVEAVAFRAGIPRIEAVGVQEARRYLLGRGRQGAGEGKDAVWRMCRTLGWPVTNNDEADACAIWAHGCGLLNPRVAHLTTPLFSGRPRINAG